MSTVLHIELIGNYPKESRAIGTGCHWRCHWFSKANVTLYPLHGVEYTNPCPMACDDATDTHEHEHEYLGGCNKNCAHDQDDRPPNDGKYDFTISLEVSEDEKTWSPVASCQVTPANALGPYELETDIKATWIRVSVVSNAPTSNADIMTAGSLVMSDGVPERRA